MALPRGGPGRFAKAGGGSIGVDFTGDWEAAVRICTGASVLFPRACDVALRRIAVEVEGDVKRNIKAGPPPPQSPLTIATGGGGKPLNRAGDLANSVNVVNAGALAYFIGIPRTAGTYSLAVVHERGAIIVQPLTARMRAFLHARLAKVGPPSGGATGILVTQIPARPFVEPAVDKLRSRFAQRFAREFATALAGQIGWP